MPASLALTLWLPDTVSHHVPGDSELPSGTQVVTSCPPLCVPEVVAEGVGPAPF